MATTANKKQQTGSRGGNSRVSNQPLGTQANGSVQRAGRRQSTANSQAASEIAEPRTPRANRRGVDQAVPQGNNGSSRSSNSSQLSGMSDEERNERRLQSKREAAQRFKARLKFEAAGEAIPTQFQLRISRNESLDADPTKYDDNGNYIQNRGNGNGKGEDNSSRGNNSSSQGAQMSGQASNRGGRAQAGNGQGNQIQANSRSRSGTAAPRRNSRSNGNEGNQGGRRQ